MIMEFDGIGPDGKPAKFRLASGKLYSYKCPDCGAYNGGGIETTDWPAGSVTGNPTERPCIECNKGPMIIEYELETP